MLIKNVYTITNDTKVVSKIIEILLIPKLFLFAEKNGLELTLPTKQNYYPDLTFKDSEGNQLEAVTSVIREKDWTFHNCDFMGLIEQVQCSDK